MLNSDNQSMILVLLNKRAVYIYCASWTPT